MYFLTNAFLYVCYDEPYFVCLLYLTCSTSLQRANGINKSKPEEEYHQKSNWLNHFNTLQGHIGDSTSSLFFYCHSTITHRHSCFYLPP